MKKKIYFLFLFMVSVFIVHSCIDEFYAETENHENPKARELLSEAKAWYDGVSESGVSVLHLTSGDTEFPVKPDWERYTFCCDTAYEAVEIELRTRYSMTMVDDKAGEKYRSTGDNRYRNSSLNLVFRKDLKTGDISGFFMNILPDAEYLESINFEYTKRMNCLKPDTAFCGRVVYYDADGKFMNGWRYRQGKIVTSLKPIPKKIGEYLMEHPSTRSDDCMVYTTWNIYDVYNEWYAWTIYCDYHFMEYMYTEIEFDIWYECETEVIDYGNGGGGGYSYHDANPITVDPCSKARSMSLDATLKNKVESLFLQVASGNMQSGTVEDGWIKTTDGQYLNPSKQETGSMNYDSPELAGKKFTERFHTQPGGAPFPSFADLRVLAHDYQEGRIDVANFTYGVITDFGCLNLVITSEDAFREFAAGVWNNDTNLKERYNGLKDIPNVHGLDTSIGKFIDFLSSSGLGVLFRPAINDGDDNITWGNWTPRYSSGDNYMRETNCN
jgi:hypothetical protein